MYENLKNRFSEVFGDKPAFLFSAPGRTELCGNHTDHQGGVVLAAAINLETVAAVRPREDGKVRLLSEGYPMCELSLDVLEPQEAERGSTKGLIRGVASGFSAFWSTHSSGSAGVENVPSSFVSDSFPKQFNAVTENLY